MAKFNSGRDWSWQAAGAEVLGGQNYTLWSILCLLGRQRGCAWGRGGVLLLSDFKHHKPKHSCFLVPPGTAEALLSQCSLFSFTFPPPQHSQSPAGSMSTPMCDWQNENGKALGSPDPLQGLGLNLNRLHHCVLWSYSSAMYKNIYK